MNKTFPSLLRLHQAATAEPPTALTGFWCRSRALKKQIPLTALLLTLWSGLGECDLGSQQPGGCAAGAQAVHVELLTCPPQISASDSLRSLAADAAPGVPAEREHAGRQQPRAVPAARPRPESGAAAPDLHHPDHQEVRHGAPEPAALCSAILQLWVCDYLLILLLSQQG